MKVCSKCKLEKDFKEFDKKGKGLSSHCKVCRKEYVNSHYKKNKEYYKKKAKTSRKKSLDFYNQYKSKLKCTDCELSFKDYPYLCDLHHPEDDKEFHPSTLKLSRQKFIKEAKKCIPLCSNCHRIRHHLARVSLTG